MIKNGILLLLLLTISLSAVAPRTAHAIPVVVLEIPDMISNILNEVVNFAKLLYDKLWDNFVEYVLKIALEEFKLKVLDLMNQQVVSWVTKGENGVPKFIQNWEVYLFGSYELGYNSVGGELRAANLCGQFKNAIINSNWKNVNLPADPNSTFGTKMECTLDTLLRNLGSSPQDYQKDFRNGGWLAYSERLINPQNNYLGAYFMASDEAAARGESKQNAAQQQGVASKGFIPVKKCADPLISGAGISGCGQFQITSPASVFENALNAGIKGRFDYIVNADQMVTLVLIIAESFANKLIQSGVDGLFGYGGSGGKPSEGYIDQNVDCTIDPTGSLCRSQGYGASSSAPVTLQPNGSTCTINSDCLSLICGPGPINTCISPQDNGFGCNAEIQCKSTLCGPANTCIDPLSNGKGCTKSSQCISSYCPPTISKCADYPTGEIGQGGLDQPCLATTPPSCNAPWTCTAGVCGPYP